MRHHWSSLCLTVLLVKLMKQQCINLKISCVSFGDLFRLFVLHLRY
jgi:hypothetical protein